MGIGKSVHFTWDAHSSLEAALQSVGGNWISTVLQSQNEIENFATFVRGYSMRMIAPGVYQGFQVMYPEGETPTFIDYSKLEPYIAVKEFHNGNF